MYNGHLLPIISLYDLKNPYLCLCIHGASCLTSQTYREAQSAEQWEDWFNSKGQVCCREQRQLCLQRKFNALDFESAEDIGARLQ